MQRNRLLGWREKIQNYIAITNISGIIQIYTTKVTMLHYVTLSVNASKNNSLCGMMDLSSWTNRTNGKRFMLPASQKNGNSSRQRPGLIIHVYKIWYRSTVTRRLLNCVNTQERRAQIMGESFQKWYTKAGFALFLLLLLMVTVIAANDPKKYEQSGNMSGNFNQHLETLIDP